MIENNFININCIIGSFDYQLFAKVINIGIDGHLEAFVKSIFKIDPHDKNRFNFLFHKDEIGTLLRRLREQGQEEFIIWAEDIELVFEEKFGNSVAI